MHSCRHRNAPEPAAPAVPPASGPASASARRPSSDAFPDATPLNVFLIWNEARRDADRRYRILCRLQWLLDTCGSDSGLAYLAGLSAVPLPVASIRASAAPFADDALRPVVAAAQQVIDALQAAVGASDPVRHAALFRAFEALAEHIDLDALARGRTRPSAGRAARRRVLIIKLGALGDFIQALAPMSALRRFHQGDRLTLLTTGSYAEFARQIGLFDDILIDHRPHWSDFASWLALRRMLRAGRFDRVYDLQTSDRSNFYFRMLWPGRRPEWSGTARRCSHPHANPGRDRLHTIDRQAEQLLMAGIFPIAPAPTLPPARKLPTAIAGRRFVLLIPGSSPRHPAKRWPADRYGELACGLLDAGYVPVVVGIASEKAAGCAIVEACSGAVDLIGRTDILDLAALAQAAALTIGNDTGATHVAAAGGHPVLVLFSHASHPSLCAPRGAMVRVLAEPNLTNLPVAAVLAAGLALAAQ